MKIVKEYIIKKQTEFRAHSFFHEVASESEYSRTLAFASGLTFWIMAFQDVLRLNEKLIQDQELKKLAKHHKIEDTGHDRWFLEDLKLIGQAELSLSDLFSKKMQNCRDATYMLMSEIFRTNDDIIRIILVLVLESSAGVFFEQVANRGSKFKAASPLKYFSHHHLDVEKGHELFENELEEQIYSRILTEKQREEAFAMADRAYEAFSLLLKSVLPEQIQLGQKNASTYDLNSLK